jgi:hypothetical protein
MKTIIHHFRIAGVLLLTIAGSSSGWGQETGPSRRTQQQMEAARRGKAAWEANVRLELRAIGEVGGEPVAMVDIDGNPVMVIRGVVFLRREVKSIDQQRKEVTLETSGEPDTVLQLTNPRPVAFPVLSPQAVERLLQPNSQRRHEVERGMPHEVLAAWKQINRDAQEEILMNYLREGLAWGSYGFGEFPGSGFRAHLFENQRNEIMAGKRAAFLASLSDDQRGIFTVSYPAVRFDAMPSPAERAAMSARIQADQKKQEEVVRVLTPEQRMLYDQWRAYLGG